MIEASKDIRYKLRELGSQIQRSDAEFEISEPEIQLNIEIEELMSQRLLLDIELKEAMASQQLSEANVAILAMKKHNIDRQLKAKIIRKYLFIRR